MNLRITEIFLSLQGESRTVGLPTVFIRLTGCPLRCVYCDTEYAFHGGTQISLEDIVKKALDYGVKNVCVTGGEPLAQPNYLTLMQALVSAGLDVSLETSGSMDIAGVDPKVSVVMDLKTPASGELDKNCYANLDLLKPKDQLKFVICDRQDYDWAKLTLDRYNLYQNGCELLFSPSFEQVKPTQLADWIVADALAVRMQLQLHKILWNDEPGR